MFSISIFLRSFEPLFWATRFTLLISVLGIGLGLVVGATYPEEIERVRALAPTAPLLIPGVGAQGGDAVATVRAGWRPDAPVVVNSSRAICYASSGDDFAAAARREAMRTRDLLEAAKP